MNVYAYSDYRDWIRDHVETRRKISSDLNFSKLAEATEIQRTFLSRFLSKDAHLSADQLFAICDFFDLPDDDSNFLFLLLEQSRTTRNRRKESLLRKIFDLQKSNLTTESHLELPVVISTTPLQLEKYFLDPYMQIVHVMLTIEEYRLKPSLIPDALNIAPSRFEGILASLCEMQLIAQSSQGYEVLSERMHLPKNSPLCSSFLVQQRIKALDQIQRVPFEKTYAFSATFAADSKVESEIKAEFLKFLEFAQQISASATPTNVYQINFDLFPWTDSE